MSQSAYSEFHTEVESHIPELPDKEDRNIKEMVDQLIFVVIFEKKIYQFFKEIPVVYET